jgi:cytochrome o ubiquinol oxidase subunit II
MRDLIRRARRPERLLLLLPMLLLSGCNWDVLNPQGAVGVSEKALLITSVLLMLLIVVPVIALTLYFAWHFRASNTKAKYLPDFHHSLPIEIIVWVIPCLIILALGIITWNSTHELDPYRRLASGDKKPINVEVVALDWKWLFIYPDLHVASVNEMAMPVGTPIAFNITSDTVMNSFFIPQLGTQIYAMAGMQTRLHLMADSPGDYRGISANFSGDGFSDMHFSAIATDQAGFDAWVQKARQSGAMLDAAAMAKLEQPSQDVPVSYFGSVSGDPYLDLVSSFMGKAMSMQEATHPSEHAATSGSSGGMAGMNMKD